MELQRRAAPSAPFTEEPPASIRAIRILHRRRLQGGLVENGESCFPCSDELVHSLSSTSYIKVCTWSSNESSKCVAYYLVHIPCCLITLFICHASSRCCHVSVVHQVCAAVVLLVSVCVLYVVVHYVLQFVGFLCRLMFCVRYFCFSIPC